MAYTSLSFLVFLTVVIVAYYLVPKKYQWTILLVASYVFYLFSGVSQVLYLVWTTLFSYGSALLMQRIRDRFKDKQAAFGDEITKEQKREMKKAVSKRIRTIQVLTVMINLGVLAYVKYLNFFIGNLNNLFSLFRWDASLPLINIIAPLGLSYFTFNSIGYLVDVGRGKYPAERNLGKFALFTSFFPSIVQGPLNRFADVGKQLQSPHKLEYDNLKFGAQLMLWGFFKKLVIADRVAPIVSTVFAPGFEYTGTHVIFGVLAYSFQIYCDFSGGVDITRGAAQMMGITLPLNFARPFFATSLGDFWRRWHMSLGAWMREYVFYPIMLSKPVQKVSKNFRQRYGAYAGKIVPSVAAPLVVFFLIGIWHGLTWQYIVNGLYHAILIASSVAMEPVFKKMVSVLHVKTETFAFRVFQMFRTFVLVCISRIIVKAPSLAEAGRMLKSVVTSADIAFITGRDGTLFTDYGISRKGMLVTVISIIILFVISVLQERGMKIRETISRKNIFVRWGLILMLLAIVLIFGIYGPGYNAKDFIYGAF